MEVLSVLTRYTINSEKLSYFKLGNVFDASETNMPLAEIEKQLNPVLDDQSFFASMWSVTSSGNIDMDFVFFAIGTRGVLSLKPNTPINGTGSTTDPYVVQD